MTKASAQAKVRARKPRLRPGRRIVRAKKASLTVDERVLREVARDARRAGEALATVRGASVVDAVVMCSAAGRNDRVVTSDGDDLDRLKRHFPNVRLIRV